MAAILYFILKGYTVSWTGFGAQAQLASEITPRKTLWDWLDLLIVPVVLGFGGYFFDRSRKRSQQEVESDRQRQQILEKYIDTISELILEGHLIGATETDIARDLARTRTLTALRLLDGARKAQLLQFLYEANLIQSPPVIELNGADFSDANLDEAVLVRAELRGVYFKRATIRRANLASAVLSGSDFSHANFSYSNLKNSILAQAIVDEATFEGTKVEGADFSEVSLGDEQLTDEQRSQLTSK